MFKSKKSKSIGLVLLALVLVSALGAKMYSDITMNDDDWIGLAYNAGRIEFDDQPVDEVCILDADVGVGTHNPWGKFAVYSPNSLYESISTAGMGYARTFYKRNNVWVGSIGAGDDGAFSLGTGSGTAPDQLVLASNGDVLVGDGLAVEGEVTALQVTTEGSVCAQENVIAFGDVLSLGEVNANEDIFTSGGNVIASIGNMIAGADVLAGGDVLADGNVIAGSEEAPGNVYGTDVYAGDNVIAGRDVTLGESVFIGSDEDDDEDGARMTLRANNNDGGYVNWAIRDFEGTVFIFDAYGDVGPEMVLYVQWLTHSNTTGAYTSGDAMLINGPHAQSSVTIAGIPHTNDLGISFYEDDVTLYTVGAGGYLYDVALLMMWVED